MHAHQVVTQRGHLVIGRAELKTARVDVVLCLDLGVDLVLGRLGHRALRVRHDEYSCDVEQVGAQHEGAQDVLGDATPRVAQHLGVAGADAEDAEGINP